MNASINYAKVGGPPYDWMDIKVVDLETGLEVSKVIEVDVLKGLLLRYRCDENGYAVIDPSGKELEREILKGRFEIVRKAA